MPIPISSNFHLSGQLPLDDKTIKVDLTARNAIPSGDRFQGLKVFVTAEQKNYQLIGGITNSNWLEIISIPDDGIFDWVSNKYQPYATTTSGAFDSSIVAPSHTVRLNYDGYLHATRLYEGDIRVSVFGHTHSGTYESVLGNPSVNNDILVSSTIGTRTWASIASLLPKATINTLGVIKVGAFLTIDGNGVLNGQAGGSGGAAVWGSITSPLGGDLHSQTDLDSELALKAPLISPSFTTPALGTPASGNLANCTFPTLNQSTTGVASGIGPEAVNKFSIIQNGTNLEIKYGSNLIVTISSVGLVTAENDVIGFTTL
jgi:hypothetical protein